jgi:hypothetical protein
VVRRFERDDEGYLAWLAAHPDGYVLNTYMHVTSDYLVLHRARCRTINRPLAADRTWTFAYGKTCSDDRAELEAWALSVGGRPAHPCGICLPVAAKTPRSQGAAGTSGGAGHGPRAPRPSAAVSMDGPAITIRVPPMPSVSPEAPPLVIEGAQWLAETFFTRDPSAVGPKSYDARVFACQRDPAIRDRVTDDDVKVVNTTMAAHAAHELWAKVIAFDDWSWLTALDPEWDLFLLSDQEWDARAVRGLLQAAFAACQQKGVQIAVVTKILHMKRPKLIPVLDSLVVGQVSGRVTADVASWVDLLEHLRSVGQANLPELQGIRRHLLDRRIEERTLVRILDSLLWTCTPGSALFGHLAQWERVFRPRSIG